MPLALLPFPPIDPVLFKIGPFSIGSLTLGPFSIRWYALAYIFGILLGWLYARRIIVKEQLWGGPAPFTMIDLDDFVLWVTLGIILGGRIGYVLFYNLNFYAAHPLEVFKVWDGGMSFHGGFLGCVLAVVLFAWKRGIPFLSVGDITCAAGPIGLFLGRLANFVNGELWGRETDVPWAMKFPLDPDHLPRHPSQLYEATLEGLVLLVILNVLVRRGALKHPGLIIGAFAMIYAVMRAFCELFREPDVQLGFLWRGTTMGMLLSIPLFLAGIGFVAYALRRQPVRST
jgi:phosphatidylglycerol:prolipoprotein diacylglycerol transferase